jgi:hypothetical protein
MRTLNIVLEMPEGRDAKLWRYMDLWRFVDLIQRKELWFTRLDRFEDKYEGFFPKAIQRALEVLAAKAPAYAEFTYPKWRLRGCINCWYISDHESAAMWDLYSAKSGLAISSTITRLKAALADAETGPWGIYGNGVRYVDFESYDPLFVSAADKEPIVTAAHLLCKRKSFEHEREYRITSTLDGDQVKNLGKHVAVDLSTMISGVYIAPNGSQWIGDVVRGLLKTYGLTIDVTHSDLYAPVVK